MVLKGLQADLGATTGIAHPAEFLVKEAAYAVDDMVIQSVDHGLDDAPGLFGLAAVVVLRQCGLLGAGAGHGGHS